MLDKRAKAFKWMLVDTFDEQYDSDLYTVRYHLFYHISKDLRKFGTLSVFASSPY